jgi:hypothetical protein
MAGRAVLRKGQERVWRAESPPQAGGLPRSAPSRKRENGVPKEVAWL